MLNKSFQRGWATLGGAGLAYGVEIGAIVYPFGLFLPFIIAEFGWSRGALSVAPALSYFLGAFFSPIAGLLVVKYGPRICIMAGGILNALAMLSMAFLGSLWQLYFAYGLLVAMGVALAGLVPSSTLASNWFERSRPLALGIITASGSIGALIFIPLLAIGIEDYGWRSAYLFLFPCVLLLTTVLPGFLIRNHPSDLDVSNRRAEPLPPPEANSLSAQDTSGSKSSDFTLGQSLRETSFWLLAGAWGIALFSMAIMTTHAVSYLLDMGVDTPVAATIFSFLPGMSVIGKLGAGFLGFKVETRIISIGAIAMMAFAMLLFTASSSIPLIFAAVIGFGLGFGAALTSFLDCFPSFFGSENNAKIIGVGLPIGLLIGGIGAPFAGYMFDATGNYFIPFSSVIGLLVVGMIFMVLARKPYRVPSESECPTAGAPQYIKNE